MFFCSAPNCDGISFNCKSVECRLKRLFLFVLFLPIMICKMSIGQRRMDAIHCIYSHNIHTDGWEWHCILLIILGNNLPTAHFKNWIKTFGELLYGVPSAVYSLGCYAVNSLDIITQNVPHEERSSPLFSFIAFYANGFTHVIWISNTFLFIIFHFFFLIKLNKCFRLIFLCDLNFTLM